MKKKKTSGAPAATKKKLDTMEIAKTAGMAAGSALVGGLAGASIGRPSLAVGLATILCGAYLAQTGHSKYSVPVMTFGTAMAIVPSIEPAVPATTTDTPVAGLSGFTMEEVKGRATIFLKNVGRKTYAEKISPELATKMGLDGLGNVASTERVFLPAHSPAAKAEQVERILQRMRMNPGNRAVQQNIPVAGLFENPDASLLGVDRDTLLAGVL